MKFSNLLQGLSSSLNKSKGQVDENGSSQSSSSDRLSAVKNWYEERYETVVVQRNLIIAMLIMASIIVVVCIIAVMAISTSKSFDPFVIQIDEQTGATEVVNPISSELISGNEALARYFIKKYVTERETYNAASFDTYAKKVVRLLSSSSVFWSYLGYIRNPANDPVVKYGQKNTTYLTVRSWSKIKDHTYILRFSITETTGGQIVMHKIAIIDIDYVPMELTEEERDINPIGFQVVGYKVDDDNS